jgi:DNA-binding XRE family transcriptional regulator
MKLTISESALILRRRRGWTQGFLARLAEVPENAVYQLERDWSKAFIKNTIKIFEALGYLIEYDDSNGWMISEEIKDASSRG